MKLEGSWYISVDDDKQTSTYPDCTDVELLDVGTGWVRYVLGDRIYVTNRVCNMRANLHAAKKSE
jgi:hypothetical protein